MEGADESIELWEHPQKLFYEQQFELPLLSSKKALRVYNIILPNFFEQSLCRLFCSYLVQSLNHLLGLIPLIWRKNTFFQWLSMLHALLRPVHTLDIRGKGNNISKLATRKKSMSSDVAGTNEYAYF